LQVAIGMVNNAGYAGFGFPATPFTMIGTNAVVVRKCANCSSGARVDGYQLTDKIAADKVPGSFAIRNATAAALPDGTLVATFTVDLNNSITDLMSGPFNHVYAVGPLDPNENILFHEDGLFPYGGENVVLKSDDSLAGANTTDTTMLSSPVVAGGPPPNAVAAPPNPVLVPQSEAASMNFSSCTPILGASSEDFNACTTLENGLQMLWKTPPDLTVIGGGNISMTFGLSGSVAPGRWSALGFPVVPAQMIGTTAMFLTLCSSCPGGVSLLDYYLAAQAPSSVTHPGRVAVSNITTGLSAGGQAQAVFTVSEWREILRLSFAAIDDILKISLGVFSGAPMSMESRGLHTFLKPRTDTNVNKYQHYSLLTASPFPFPLFIAGEPSIVCFPGHLATDIICHRASQLLRNTSTT
jgi:hypothetical protein